MKLAIQGGEPIRKKLFPAYNTIGEEEKNAVAAVLDTGVLSKFLGSWRPDFYGGAQVQALEKEWAEYFGAKHAISVNSCTSGLFCAVGAIGTEPGEEIICSPYTMAASATAPLVYGAVPVFADIEENYFCLEVKSIERAITPRTRGIVVVDIFGQPYDADAINALAKKHDLYVIEDTAQAPGAIYRKKFAGTLGDIGVYSLNYHKHIHCGEGGMVVTDDDELADKVRLIRNHAEAVVGPKGTTDLVNMVGFNYRMTEIEAAITRVQLRKLRGLVEERRQNCEYIAEKLSGIPAIQLAPTREGAIHSHYGQVFKFFEEKAGGVHRNKFIQAIRAELPACELREEDGALVGCGYVKPLYLQPMFQKKIAFGSKGFPFTSPHYQGKVSYEEGLCPVAERMHFKELFSHELMRPGMRKEDLDDVARAFWKVWELRSSL